MTALRLLGAFLLAATGWGAGWGAAQAARRQWRELHTFVRLLEHLRDDLICRALPGDELLASASLYPEFSPLALGTCRSLAALPLPDALDTARQMEIRAGLQGICLAPREQAAAALERLAKLCREAEEEKHTAAGTARALYPRLGLCLGVMAAILLA